MDMSAIINMAETQGVPGSLLLPVGLAGMEPAGERAPAFLFNINLTVYALLFKADPAHGLPLSYKASNLDERYMFAGAPVLHIDPQQAAYAPSHAAPNGAAFRSGEDEGWVVTVSGLKPPSFVTTRGSVINLRRDALIEFWTKWIVSRRNEEGATVEVYCHNA